MAAWNGRSNDRQHGLHNGQLYSTLYVICSDWNKTVELSVGIGTVKGV